MSSSAQPIYLFRQIGQEFNKAALLYSMAIQHNPTDATLFCNRAYARMKLEEHGYAADDCSMSSFFFVNLSRIHLLKAKAIALDPKYVKAYYRLEIHPVCICAP